MSIKTKKRFKNVMKWFGLIFILLINFFIVTQGVVYSKQPGFYGEWGTSNSCESGTLVSWSCYESETIQCAGGDTGQGYCP